MPVVAEYEGTVIHFSVDGWFNATTAAARFGKSPHEWLRLPGTVEYLDALTEADVSNTGKSRIWTRSKRGNAGGTWLHPKLAVRFAQWLDVRFAIWCDEQIDALIRGTHPHYELRLDRAALSASQNVLNAALATVRSEDGKETAGYHFANEARLINDVLAGQWAKLDRDCLSREDMRLLIKLTAKDTMLIAQRKSYAERRTELEAFAVRERAKIEAPAAIGRAA